MFRKIDMFSGEFCEEKVKISKMHYTIIRYTFGERIMDHIYV